MQEDSAAVLYAKMRGLTKEKMIQHIQDGESLDQMAVLYGSNRHAVSQLKKQYQIPASVKKLPKGPAVPKEVLRELYDQDLTDREIAAKLGDKFSVWDVQKSRITYGFHRDRTVELHKAVERRKNNAIANVQSGE